MLHSNHTWSLQTAKIIIMQRRRRQKTQFTKSISDSSAFWLLSPGLQLSCKGIYLPIAESKYANEGSKNKDMEYGAWVLLLLQFYSGRSSVCQETYWPLLPPLRRRGKFLRRDWSITTCFKVNAKQALSRLIELISDGKANARLAMSVW